MDGFSAWEVIPSNFYRFLRMTHSWRPDVWSRGKLIGYCGTNLLRHAKSFEHNRVFLDDCGRMPVEELLSFRMCRALGATIQDLERAVLEDQDPANEKSRFNPEHDKETALLINVGFAQGWSEKAAGFLDQKKVMKKLRNSIKNLKRNFVKSFSCFQQL